MSYMMGIETEKPNESESLVESVTLSSHPPRLKCKRKKRILLFFVGLSITMLLLFSVVSTLTKTTKIVKTRSFPAMRTLISSTESGLYSDTMLPDVLFVGVQKSGSSALADWVFGGYQDENTLHSLCYAEILEGEPEYHQKEVHYFDTRPYFDKHKGRAFDVNRDEINGLDIYLEHFKHCVESHHMSMDATPGYFRYPDNIHATYSKLGEENYVKIVITLREPVAREFSWYNHQLVTGQKSTNYTFEERIENKIMHDIQNKHNLGMYAHFLRFWMTYFDRKNILILSYQELRNDPMKGQWRLQQFLGLSDDELEVTGELPRTNTHESPLKKPAPYCTEWYYKLVKMYEPLNEELYEYLEKYPGPEMEAEPFPKFEEPSCISIDDDVEEEMSQ